jgi:hypothetical protein
MGATRARHRDDRDASHEEGAADVLALGTVDRQVAVGIGHRWRVSESICQHSSGLLSDEGATNEKRIEPPIILVPELRQGARWDVLFSLRAEGCAAAST